ncbi:hypothetical protein AB0D87_44615, partial [Streptomyces sp. NPDC048342]
MTEPGLRGTPARPVPRADPPPSHAAAGPDGGPPPRAAVWETHTPTRFFVGVRVYKHQKPGDRGVLE